MPAYLLTSTSPAVDSDCSGPCALGFYASCLLDRTLAADVDFLIGVRTVFARFEASDRLVVFVGKHGLFKTGLTAKQ